MDVESSIMIERTPLAILLAEKEVMRRSWDTIYGARMLKPATATATFSIPSLVTATLSLSICCH